MPARIAGVTARREDLADRFIAMVPALKQRFQASLPADLSDELCNVTPHQMEALHYLHRPRRGPAAGGGITMHELARLQHCGLSSATALADRLIKQGLAERLSDEADRRVVRIAPTARGAALTARFAQVRRQVALEALEALTDAEIETLTGLLHKVAHGGAAGEEAIA